MSKSLIPWEFWEEAYYAGEQRLRQLRIDVALLASSGAPEGEVSKRLKSAGWSEDFGRWYATHALRHGPDEFEAVLPSIEDLYRQHDDEVEQLRYKRSLWRDGWQYVTSPTKEPEPSSGGRLTDAPAAANLPCALDDGRLQRKSSDWSSYPLDGSLSSGEPPSRGRRRPPPAEVIRLEFLSPEPLAWSSVAPDGHAFRAAVV